MFGFNIGATTKLFIVIGTGLLAYTLWVKGVIDSKNNIIDSLRDDIEAKTTTIEANKKHISELEQYKLIETGLTKIITYQSQRYTDLREEYEQYRTDTMRSVRRLSTTERDAGAEIDLLWDMYRGSRQ